VVRRDSLRGDAGRTGRHQALGVQRSAEAQRQTQGRAAVARRIPRADDARRRPAPITIAQNARTSGGGNIALVPTQAITVGPLETWRAEKVSIWQAGKHDNPFGMRLTTLMISKKVPDSAVPMSLLADHPNVQFNFFRGGLGTCEIEMH